MACQHMLSSRRSHPTDGILHVMRCVRSQICSTIRALCCCPQPDKYLPRIQFEEKFCMACFWEGQDPESSYITHFLKVRMTH